ncbi:uro-adherence factor A-like isoform X2 [Littorina saxatilis]|uniref:Uncharacterized protein n=1 Tax=Littorina saxatilis TaxID=31220 RepID=A0AAN9GHK7_9CAEN
MTFLMKRVVTASILEDNTYSDVIAFALLSPDERRWVVKNLPPNFEHVAAIQIQRIWRGHRVRRIIGDFFAYVRTQLEKESPISVSEHNAELKNNPRQSRPRIRKQQSQEQPVSTSEEQLSTEQSPSTKQPSIDEQSSFQEFSTGQSSLSAEELSTGQFSLAKQTSSSTETFSLAKNYSWTKQKSRDITKKPGVEHSYSSHELPTKQVSFAKLPASIERRSFGKLQSTEQSWSGTEQPSLGNKRSLERVSSATQSDIAHPCYTRQQSEDLSLSRKRSITEDSSFKQQPSSDQSLGGRQPSLEHPLVDKWLSSEHLLLARTQSVDLPLSSKQSITSTEQPTPIPPAGTDRPLVQPRTDQSLGEVGTNNTDRLVTQVLKGESVEETQPEKQQESEPLQQTSFQPPREPVLSEKDLSLKTESAEKILTEAQPESKLFQQTNFQQPSELLPERKLSVEKESVQKVQPEKLQEQTSLQEPSELLPERKLSVEKESVQKVQPEELQEQTSLEEPSELLPERKLSVQKKSVQKVQPEKLQEQTSHQEPSELLPERKLSVPKKSVQKVQPEKLQEQTSHQEPSELLPERKLSVQKKSVQKVQPEKLQEQTSLQEPSKLPPEKLFVRKSSVQKVAVKLTLFQQTSFEEVSELFPGKELLVEKESAHNIQPSVEQQERKIFQQTRFLEPSELLPERKLSVEKESVQKVQPEELQEQTSLEEPSELLPERKLSVEKKTAEVIQPRTVFRQTRTQPASRLLLERELSAGTIQPQKQRERKLVQPTSFQLPSILFKEASPRHLTADRHHKPDLKEEPAAKRRKMTKKSAARLALEASYDRYVQKALQQGKASKDMMQFAEYCAYRLQVWWLMKHRKFLRERMMKRSLALRKKMALHSVSDMQVEITEAHVERRRRIGPLTKGDAATSIQRAWRRHIDIQVYRYYRDLINFRTRGDPSVMLRCINPNEANLLEPGSGTAVRFRLAGDRFPPNIYYKIFTHRPIQDLCANSPKDYTRPEAKKLTVRHKHNKVAKLPPQEDITQEHWYKRCENNGWRLVSDRLVHHIMNDPVTWESSKKTYHFHHSKLKRKQDVEKQKKSRKIDWMKKMYKEGMLHARADDPETVQLIEGATAGMIATVENQGPEALEDWEVDELLDWTTSLDFEEYFDTWKNLATSAAADNKLGAVKKEFQRL